MTRFICRRLGCIDTAHSRIFQTLKLIEHMLVILTQGVMHVSYSILSWINKNQALRWPGLTNLMGGVTEWVAKGLLGGRPGRIRLEWTPT
jgi:hypothetical protein